MSRKPVGQQALDRALDEKEDLLLVYQPIHDSRTGKIRAAEALLRQRRESGELRETTVITDTAEKGPELFALDSITFRTAFIDAGQWMAADPDVRLHVNLSPREFQERDIVPRLQELVGECKVDLTRINLEITETSYIECPEETVSVLAQIRELGIQLWLDDFGTRHSNLSHILHFDLDGLKIPAEFIEGAGEDERCSAITRSLITLAHEMDLGVIAEGVENERQLDFLLQYDCEFIQGFLFSRPMPLPEFQAALRRSSEASPLPARARRDAGRGPSSPSS